MTEKYKTGKYNVITLCGSTRHKDAFMEAQKRLTLEGNIVISVGLFGHDGDPEVREGMAEDALTKTKEMLDDMQKRKIDLSDEMLRSYIDRGEIYFMMDGGGMTVISMRQGEEYGQIPWQADLLPDEVATIHLLAVCPAHRG